MIAKVKAYRGTFDSNNVNEQKQKKILTSPSSVYIVGLTSYPLKRERENKLGIYLKCLRLRCIAVSIAYLVGSIPMIKRNRIETCFKMYIFRPMEFFLSILI